MDVRWGKFIWNSEKAEKNQRKGRPSFYQGASAFDDRNGIVIDDLKHSTPIERRQWLIAKDSASEVLLVVFTEREFELTRLISVRHADKKERRIYESQNK